MTGADPGLTALPPLTLIPDARPLGIALGDRSYPIHIGPLDWADCARQLVRPGHLAMIVSNETVAPLYAERLRAALADVYPRVAMVCLPDGESHKSWASVQQLQAALAASMADAAVASGGSGKNPTQEEEDAALAAAIAASTATATVSRRQTSPTRNSASRRREGLAG